MGGRRGNQRNRYSEKKAKAQPVVQAEPAEVVIADGLRYQQLISKSMDNLKNDAEYCYLISTKWLNSWKDYTGYQNLVKGEDPSDHKSFRKKRPGKMNTDLLGKDDKFLKVPEQLPTYSFLNVVTDSDVQKDKDFIVVDSTVFSFFHQKYDGNIIQRPFRKGKGKPYFDIHLHQFYFCFLSPDDISTITEATDQQINKKLDDFISIKKMQVSVLWDIKRLKEFLVEYIQVKYNVNKLSSQISLWKFENFLQLIEVKKQIANYIRKDEKEVLARNLAEEEERQLDLDDFLKQSSVVFVDFNEFEFLRAPLPQKIKGYCQQCVKINQLTESCPCGRVFYCSTKCQYDDKPYHFRSCSVTYESQDDQEYLKKEVKAGESKCGLCNLGNTCYMNSTLQCLTSIKLFARYFTSNQYLQDLSPDEEEQNKCIFIKKFAKFVKKLHEQELIAPWSLKGQISYFIAPFKNYEQHDANDMTVYLLNTLNDFVRKVNDSSYGQFIHDTFLGSFNSHVKCPHCQMTSTTRDPFLEVSVPLKSKQAVKELKYYIIYDWNNYSKGSCKLLESWPEIELSIGLPLDAQIRKVTYSGVEIVEQSPQEIWKKQRHDPVYFYFEQKYQSGTYITVQLSATKHLSGIQTKYRVGQTQYIQVDETLPVCTLYQNAAKLVQVDKDTLAKMDQILKEYQVGYAKIKEPAETQISENSEKDKEKDPNEIAKELQTYENTKAKEFSESLSGLLKFKLHMKIPRKGKKPCEFCNKKCNGCQVPFVLSKSIHDLLQKSPQFKLEVLFNADVMINQQSLPCNFQQHTTIQQCLEQFTKPQELDEQNAWWCSQCEDMRLAHKQLEIEQEPPVLMIQLKRFKQVNNKKVKNNEIISYKEQLTVKGKQYRLNSIVVHEGSLEGGHYWAICRKGDKYYSFNDESVKESDYFHRNAYLIFYERM